MLLRIVLHWGVLAVGVFLATKFLPGIQCDDGRALVISVIALSLLNTILRPIIVMFTTPFIILSLGIGLIVINAVMFSLTARWVEGFYVEHFGWAIAGSLVVSVTNMVFSLLFGRQKK